MPFSMNPMDMLGSEKNIQNSCSLSFPLTGDTKLMTRI